MGAKVSGYLGIAIMALACIYSWLLLLDSAGVISLASDKLSDGRIFLHLVGSGFRQL